MMTNLIKRPPVLIGYSDLTYTVKERTGKWFSRSTKDKKILHNVGGQFKPGELTAIMGPSGAGKSTLMNIMAGYKTSNVGGEITINGKERNLRKFRKMSAYIMQDDALSPHLTVIEAMDVAANLKLGEKMSKEEKMVVIMEIMETLGLRETLNTRTSMLSGGQRKRLAIALELVNNPPVMFFDEPTSGLDSASCSQCIALLKQLAREGRTIVCTIHQPSARIFEMFDKVVVLCDGKTIYRGSVAGIVPFFADVGFECPSYHNPADFIMEVASGEYGVATDKFVEAVEAGKCDTASRKSAALMTTSAGGSSTASSHPKEGSPSPSEVRIEMEDKGRKADDNNQECQNSLLGGSSESIDDHCNSFPTSTWTQFRILFMRTFLSIIRDETLTKLRILSQIGIGIILGNTIL